MKRGNKRCETSKRDKEIEVEEEIHDVVGHRLFSIQLLARVALKVQIVLDDVADSKDDSLIVLIVEGNGGNDAERRKDEGIKQGNPQAMTIDPRHVHCDRKRDHDHKWPSDQAGDGKSSNDGATILDGVLNVGGIRHVEKIHAERLRQK